MWKIDTRSKVRRTNFRKLVTMELVIAALNAVTMEEEQSNLSCEGVGRCGRPVTQESNADNQSAETSTEIQKNENITKLLETDQAKECLEEQTEVLDHIEESE